MLHQLRNPKLYTMLFSDAAIFVAAILLANLFRFDFHLPAFRAQQIGEMLPYLVTFKLIVFYFFGLYRGFWRYFSLTDAWKLMQACFFSLTFIATALFFYNRLTDISRSIFLMDTLLTLFLCGGLRIGIRSLFAARNNRRLSEEFGLADRGDLRKQHKNVLIIGAGNTGEKMLREIVESPHLRLQVVGFLDDDSRKQGRSVHGIPVLGPVETLPKVCRKYDAKEVFIAIPSATGPQMRRIVETCKCCDLPYKTLPGIDQIINGKVSVKALRDVNYEDLIGRPVVHLDTEGIRECLQDQVILVTGCGGSIGSELCRQLVRYGPKALVLLDAGEASLFYIQMELHHEMNFHSYYTVLGHVQDRQLMEKVFQTYRPQVVFHAAACKHVPMLEKNPWEAVANNILGSAVTMESAVKYGVQRFVLVSTDKAVRPVNVMGASKRVAELLMHSFQGSPTRFMAVRFGNVIGSSGSVVPLFRRQIEQGGPVTVTHPEVTRFFMTIPEAAQLILQACAMGRGGEIFILNMGTPIKIVDIAKDLIRLSGKDPETDIAISFIGLREGEKLYEELITTGEGIVPTGHDKILVLHSNGECEGMPDVADPVEHFQRNLAQLYAAAERHDSKAIRCKLHEIVPEYSPQECEGIFPACSEAQ